MRKINLVGQKFERLTVIEEVPSLNKKNKRPSWKCLCSCGNIEPIIVWRSTNLTSGNSKSCGCIKSETSAENLRKTALDGRKYEPIVAAAKNIFLAKYNDGTLQFDDFYAMTQLNCYYCGVPPSTKRKNITNYDVNRATFIYNGIDRIDSNLPHNLENCITCCKECNFSKRNMSLNDFYIMIINIHNNSNNVIPNYEQLYSNNNIDLSQFKRIKGLLNKHYPDLDFDQNLFYFILKQPCLYCGAIDLNNTKCKNGDIINHNGLDRIDQTKKHTLDNVVACCKYCNWSKAKRSRYEFISWAKRVYEFCPGVKAFLIQQCSHLPILAVPQHQNYPYH